MSGGREGLIGMRFWGFVWGRERHTICMREGKVSFMAGVTVRRIFLQRGRTWCIMFEMGFCLFNWISKCDWERTPKT